MGMMIDAIVIVGVVYLSFVMALAGWIRALRKGQAVTLLPERESKSSTLWLQLGVVGFSLLVCALLFYFYWIPLPILFSPVADSVLIAIGLLLFIIGTLFIVWARHTLGSMWGISTSREVKLLPGHKLVQAGPYGLVRHPMYIGWWVALFGLILIFRTWILVLLLIFSLFVFYQRARREETALAARFGDEWQTYIRHSKFLVPFIY